MAKYRSRSRSPGTSSKRYREDDRYDRNRSRSRERYYDRERDRYREDRHRGGRDRRDRSRDRFRDRDHRHRIRSPDRARDSRDRSRSRSPSHRARYSDRRDRDRGEDSKRNSRHESPATLAPSAAQTEEDKKRERLERLEAWKKKKAEADQAKANASISLRADQSILSPTTNTAPLAPAKDEDSTSLKASTPISEKQKDFNADRSPPASRKPTLGKSDLEISKAATPVLGLSGFGFKGSSKKPGTESKGKRALDFGDEDVARKKLERLPSPKPDDINIATGEPPVDEGDDDVDMQDDLEALRAAAIERGERMQIDGTVPETQSQMNTEKEEDIDPLDAFMSNITSTATGVPKPQKGPALAEAMFGDDDDNLTAIVNDPDDILAMASKMKKKKELPTVDHSKVQYEPFRKSFYVEPAELADMSTQEVNDLRLVLDGIKVRGANCPKPVQKWSLLGLPSATLDVINKLEYEKPTSIQAQAIPAIMSGRNVIGVAKTGSGKTMAFLLPMFRHIKDQRPLENLEGPIALVMTPTRELATQIFKESKPFLKALNLRGVCAYGGSPIKDQIAELKRGAEFIVCTPGRMIDLLAANSGRVTNLKRVTYVVLDEADRMFDMGFEPQVMRIIGNIRPDRQTVLFSATFPSQMEALARKVLIKPVEIVVGARSVVAAEVSQIVEVRTENTKFARLLEILGELYDKEDDARSLVFVDRQESADSLLSDLMKRGYATMSLHGGKDQIDRDSTISDFKAGVSQVLVATSVAARGLDVKQLKLVVNYDCPNHMEDYVHRVGRTGRAGNKGTAVTFITPDQERYAHDIAKALKLSGQDVPEEVQKLVSSFSEKVKAGKEKASSSGFGGKGLDRLDQERETARKRERKAYGEEGNEGEEPDAEGEEVKTKTAIAATTTGSKGPNLDDAIVVHKRDPAALAALAAAAAAGSPSGASNAAAANSVLDKVLAATSDIQKRLTKANVLRSGAPIDNKGPDAGAYHATLEINDFPQKARWAVTNRTNIAKVLEATGTSITTKGSYYPAGKTPAAGQDPKLYILVEGDTELVVTNAMRELKRLLAEGTAAAVDSENRAVTTGRYNVL
ncbi:pre-mRNA processing RNA-helicase [Orbilia oligospora]|uniref:RNA helicase n=1 Tax=Orbilia oligospora TaxID=2813651 RepID=A0A7C8Q5D0_ORBOL|nr:pre-mRNA processing RNA-helicase [Orbilia oligospora]